MLTNFSDEGCSPFVEAAIARGADSPDVESVPSMNRDKQENSGDEDGDRNPELDIPQDGSDHEMLPHCVSGRCTSSIFDEQVEAGIVGRTTPLLQGCNECSMEWREVTRASSGRQ